MRRFLSLIAAALVAACGSSRTDNELPATIPPAEVHPQSASADPRVADIQTALTELLDRLDVLNARIAKLEAAQSAGLQSPVPAGLPVPVAQGQPRAAAVQPQVDGQPRANAQPKAAVLQDAQLADEYRRGIILVGQAKYADARTVFQRVFDADPSGDLADNALFWVGETYFAAGNYHEAMRMYERVAKEYGDQNKAPDALYKLGIAYEKTGDLGMARRTFNDCITKYPYSSPAAAARMELKRIRY